MWFQDMLVAIIVLLALAFTTWRLSGTATRLRYAAWLKRLGGGRGPLLWLGRRVERRILRAAGDSTCSGCSAAGHQGAATSSSAADQ
jgi:hypothetical protein